MTGEAKALIAGGEGNRGRGRDGDSARAVWHQEGQSWVRAEAGKYAKGKANRRRKRRRK